MSDATVAKKPRETDDVPVPPTLRKSLKNRHIQLIALGGAIGTGLFLASGATVANAGPGGALLAYAAIGLMVLLLMNIKDLKSSAPGREKKVKHKEAGK